MVVPLYNEEANVRPLVEAVEKALAGWRSWELLLVDDGSEDGTAEIAGEVVSRQAEVRLVRLARNYGQTAAMQAGFDLAEGDIIVSMDGDLQNDPEDIPRLVSSLEEGYDLVVGYRKNRKDAFLSRRLPSLVANRLIGWMTGVEIRDNGCSLKAYRSEVLSRMELYSDMHRFIPAIAAATAGARIGEIPVKHYPRRRGTSKYGLERTWKVLADMLTVKMIRTFRERPLLMFGVGAIASLTVALVLVGGSVASLLSQTSGPSVVFPTAAILALGLAAFLLMLGLVAEVAVHETWSRGEELLPVHEELRR